jgi:hypothetical protein
MFTPRTIRTMLLGVVACASIATHTLAQPQEVFPDPGWHFPRVGFQQHGVVPGTPVVRHPDIDGEPSAWRIVQWHRDAYLQPEQIQRSPSGAYEPGLGYASWRFGMPDGSATIGIYKFGGGYAFDLRERDGDLFDDGGSNLFLSASPGLPDVTLDQRLTYSIAARVSAAEISASDPAAIRRGIVMAQIFTGFVIQSVPRAGRPRVTAFLQIPMSHAVPPAAIYRHCDMHPGAAILIYNTALPTDPDLPFRTDDGPLHPLRYDLNQHFCALLAETFPCAKLDQPDFALTGELQEPRNWRLISMYLGLETQARDRRSSAATGPKAGHVVAGVSLADLHVVRGAAGVACRGASQSH